MLHTITFNIYDVMCKKKKFCFCYHRYSIYKQSLLHQSHQVGRNDPNYFSDEILRQFFF